MIPTCNTTGRNSAKRNYSVLKLSCYKRLYYVITEEGYVGIYDDSFKLNSDIERLGLKVVVRDSSMRINKILNKIGQEYRHIHPDKLFPDISCGNALFRTVPKPQPVYLFENV